MEKKLNGTEVSKILYQELRKYISDKNILPNIVDISIGEDFGSLKYAEMKKKLNPIKVLFWGNIPEELKEERNIIHMGYIMDEKFKLMRGNHE